MMESTIKSPIDTVDQSKIESTVLDTQTSAPEISNDIPIDKCLDDTNSQSEEEMMELSIKTSITERDTQIAMSTQSEAETGELAMKTASIKATATHQNEEEYHKLLELAIKSSIQERGIPVTLDGTLNDKLPKIRITNVDDSCYITNGVIVLTIDVI